MIEVIGGVNIFVRIRIIMVISGHFASSQKIKMAAKLTRNI